MNDYGFEKRSTQVKKDCTALAVLFVLSICAAAILCARSGHTVFGYILFGAAGILEIICLSIVLHYLSKYGVGENAKGYSRLLHGFLIHCIFTLTALYCMHTATVRYTLFLAFADGALGAALVLFAAVFCPHSNKCGRAWLACAAGSACALLSFFGRYMPLYWVFLILSVLLAIMAIVAAKKEMKASIRRGLVIACMLLGLMLAAGSAIWLLNSRYSPSLHMVIHTLMLLFGVVTAMCVRCTVRNEYRRYTLAHCESVGSDNATQATSELHQLDENDALVSASAGSDDRACSAKTGVEPLIATDLNDTPNEPPAEHSDSNNNAECNAAVATAAAGTAEAVTMPESSTRLNCNLALKPKFHDVPLHLLPGMSVSAFSGMNDEQVAVLEHMGAFSIADLAALPCVRHAQQIAELAKRVE